MKNYILCFIAVLFLQAFTLLNAQTTTIKIQPHFNGIENQLCILDSTNPNWASNPYKYREDSNIHNQTEIIFCGWTLLGCPQIFRQTIRFSALKDTSVIPANSTINSAKLVLYGLPSSPNGNYGNSYYSSSPNPINPGWLYEIADSFNNLSVTWNTQPGVMHNDSIVVPSTYSQWNENDTFDVTTMVADMIANKNYGFLFKLDNELPYREHLYASSYYSDSTLHPALILNYTHHNVGINNINNSAEQMLVYPTLVSSSVNVSININQNLTVSIQIFDLLGKKLYSVNKYCKSGSNNFIIPTTNLPKGNYLVKAFSGDLNMVKKIIKQ